MLRCFFPHSRYFLNMSNVTSWQPAPPFCGPDPLRTLPTRVARDVSTPIEFNGTTQMLEFIYISAMLALCQEKLFMYQQTEEKNVVAVFWKSCCFVKWRPSSLRRVILCFMLFLQVSKLLSDLPDDKAATLNVPLQCCKNCGTRTGMFIHHDLVRICASGISVLIW